MSDSIPRSVRVGRHADGTRIVMFEGAEPPSGMWAADYVHGAEVERMREALRAEAEYCYGYARKYDGVDAARAARHRERGDRLMAALKEHE